MKSNRHPALLLYREMPLLHSESGYDIVLTPQFYFYRHEEIPLRFAFQARKIAPSVFEELTDRGKALHFEVAPAENGWDFFAYDPAAIEALIREKGGRPERISRLYFAQQLAPLLREEVIRLPDSDSLLSLIDGTVTLVPKAFADGKTLREFQPELLRKIKGFPFRTTGRPSRLDRRVALLLTLSLGILGIAWIAEGFRYQRLRGYYETQVRKAAEEDPRLLSGIVRTNLRNKYQTIDTQQRKIRERVRAIGSLISKENRLQTLKIDDKGYRATLKINPAKKALLRQLAARADLPITEGRHTDTLQIRGRW